MFLNRIVFVFFFLFTVTSILADTKTEERKFIIEAKYGILPFVPIMEINTKLNVHEKYFDYHE